jgi:hypothetical protein
MVKVTPDAFVELGRFNPRMCMMTSPAVAGGKLYLRLLDGIACYDLAEHGAYLADVAASKDAITFRFQQTGGGLATSRPADSLKDVVISGPGGQTQPAKATIDGDSVVVDIKDIAGPFGVSYAGATLVGKNGLPVPPFGWNEARVLKFRKVIDNTILLTSDLPLQQLGIWNKADSFAIAGGKVTKVVLDPQGKGVTLNTDKALKPGDAVSVTYPCFATDQGDSRRETLAFTVAEPQRAAAAFVKTDDTTTGTWKGIYGAEGALIAGDNPKTAVAPKCAIVTPASKDEATPWAFTADNPRALQLTGEDKGRSTRMWVAPEQWDVGIEFTDGKEHQVAICLPLGGAITVEIQDADTKAILDSQPPKESNKQRYLVWNLKGQVTMRVISTIQDEGHAVWVGGVFIGPATH